MAQQVEIELRHYIDSPPHVWGMTFMTSAFMGGPGGDQTEPIDVTFTLHDVGSVDYDTWMSFLSGAGSPLIATNSGRSWVRRTSPETIFLGTSTPAVEYEGVEYADIYIHLPADKALEAMAAAFEEAMADGLTFAGDE